MLVERDFQFETNYTWQTDGILHVDEFKAQNL